MKAWHFLPANRKIRGTNDRATVGAITEVEGPIIPEKWGLHASKRVLQAAFWAPSLLLTRVELGGLIVEGDRKFAAETRRILWMGDVTEPFWAWAIERARMAIDDENKAGRSVDIPLLNALCACLDWRNGRISFEEMLRFRGPARTASRAVLGKNARNQQVNRPACQGAQTAALRLAHLVEGEAAHRILAACPAHMENTPARLAECDRLEKLIIEHANRGWFQMSEVEPPLNAWCSVQLNCPPRTFRGQWTGGGFRGVGAGAREVVAWRLMPKEQT